MNWISVGSIVMGLGVASGAFGAHGLRSRLDDYTLPIYEKAVFYHFLHALGILIVGALAKGNVVSQGAEMRVCTAFLIGILLFSGSLYALALSGVRTLGIITPFGGTAFLIGWGLLAWEASRS